MDVDYIARIGIVDSAIDEGVGHSRDIEVLQSPKGRFSHSKLYRVRGVSSDQMKRFFLSIGMPYCSFNSKKSVG